jgi:hypothetical protein
LRNGLRVDDGQKSEIEGNNVENNLKQHGHTRQLGGITGRGFLPGRSGNVNGRPKTNTGLVNAIRAKVAEVAPDGRTVAQHIAAMLVEESLRGRNKIAAASVILDRLEGRPAQQLDLNNITQDLAGRTDDELRFHLLHDAWPEDVEPPDAGGSENGRRN